MAIAIANIVCLWEMMLQTYAPVKFLFLCRFVTGSTSFQVVPACFRLFKFVTGGSSTFLVVSARSLFYYRHLYLTSQCFFCSQRFETLASFFC